MKIKGYKWFAAPKTAGYIFVVPVNDDDREERYRSCKIISFSEEYIKNFPNSRSIKSEHQVDLHSGYVEEAEIDWFEQFI